MNGNKAVIFKNGDKKQKDVILSRDRKEQSNTQINKKKAIYELDKLSKGSERVILDIKSVFPFTLFPDEIIVDETKVSIHKSYFFYSKEVRSIEYKDIFNIVVQQSIFFAKLEVVDRYFAQHPVTVDYLKKNDAQEARRIILSLIIVHKENIDILGLSTEELKKKLNRIGQSR